MYLRSVYWNDVRRLAMARAAKKVEMQVSMEGALWDSADEMRVSVEQPDSLTT